MKRASLVMSGLVLLVLGGATAMVTANGSAHSYVPKDGFVPDVATAIRIAEAVWEPIYGADKVQKKRPFKATLKGGVWTVTGSLPEGVIGGVPLAEIRKKDGCILRVSHGK